jgi:hypothetical protein
VLAGTATQVVPLPETAEYPLPPDPAFEDVVVVAPFVLVAGYELVVEVLVPVPTVTVEQVVDVVGAALAQLQTALAAERTRRRSAESHDVATQGVTSVVRRA